MIFVALPSLRDSHLSSVVGFFLTICMLGNFYAFNVSYADFFSQNNFLRKKFSASDIRNVK